jgi:hypothetical protein
MHKYHGFNLKSPGFVGTYSSGHGRVNVAEKTKATESTAAAKTMHKTQKHVISTNLFNAIPASCMMSWIDRPRQEVAFPSLAFHPQARTTLSICPPAATSPRPHLVSCETRFNATMPIEYR